MNLPPRTDSLMSIRRNQLYLGLMILGAAALFVDRVILPADVTAASLPQ